ncbi:metallophosphoesterase [Chloropicon primus]|nr:metallophosphoesterase [Chloropicon primus]
MGRSGGVLGVVVLAVAWASGLVSGRKFAYLDNLSPGFSDGVCERHGKGVFRGPYLQAGGHERMVVRWSSEEEGLGVVCYGKSPGRMTAAAFDQEAFPRGSEHSVALEGLDPGTEYYYVPAVTSAEFLASSGSAEVYSSGSEGGDEAMRSFLFPDASSSSPGRSAAAGAMAAGTSQAGVAAAEEEDALSIVSPAEYYSFTTFPEPGAGVEEPVRVWAIGDSGMGDHKADSVRDAFVNFTGGDWDLTLGLGDLAYNSGKDWEYQKGFFEFLSEENARVPVFTTPGNHDRPTSDLWSQTGPYFDLFTNPGDGRSGGVPSNHKSYYSFDYGPIHFVSVDSDTLGLHDDPALYAWLEKDLAEARRADYQWIVAYHHQPPYSKGSHDSDAQYECYKLRSNLVPMFEKYGVDLVLAGHSHSYERSHLLSGHFGPSGEVRSNPGVVKARWSKGEDGVETLVKTGEGENSGTLYLVTGSGAKTSGGSLDHPAMASSQNFLGSVLLEFHPSGSRLDIHMVGSIPGQDALDHAVVLKTPK